MKVGDVVKPRTASWGFFLSEEDKNKSCYVASVRPSKRGGKEIFVTEIGQPPRAGVAYTRMVNCGWFHETWFEVDEFLTAVHREKVKYP